MLWIEPSPTCNSSRICADGPLHVDAHNAHVKSLLHQWNSGDFRVSCYSATWGLSCAFYKHWMTKIVRGSKYFASKTFHRLVVIPQFLHPDMLHYVDFEFLLQHINVHTAYTYRNAIYSRTWCSSCSLPFSVSWQISNDSSDLSNCLILRFDCGQSESYSIPMIVIIAIFTFLFPDPYKKCRLLNNCKGLHNTKK